MSAFTDWLEKVMEEKNVGVNQLAEYAGISSSGVSKIRLGQRNPNSDTIKKLAKYFKVDEDWLLELSGHRSGYTPEKEVYKIQDPILRALINPDILNRLSPGGRRAIISIIQAEMEDYIKPELSHIEKGLEEARSPEGQERRRKKKEQDGNEGTTVAS